MDSFGLKKISTLGLVMAAVVSFVGCSSAKPTDDPGIDRVGKYIVKSETPDLEVVIAYRYAQQNLGSPWLLLEAATTSPPNKTATIKREEVSVTTPAGETIPLATQNDVNKAWGVVMPIVNAADVVRDPMNYWAPRAKTLLMRFYVTPGDGVSYDEFSVNNFRVCQGRFLFEIPGGVQSGRYVLNIDQPDGGINIPITFEK